METATWTQETLERLVADAVPEDLHMEYKSAEALKDRGKIAKSISSMANSDGGVVIYGMAEPSGDRGTVQLQPFDPKVCSKERLEQIITSHISPKIKGLVIHVVKVTGDPEGQCFVVEIPKSDTIHQASDQRYYRRRNFMSEPMEDYEIREGMKRSTNPKIGASIRFEIVQGAPFLVVGITNQGASIVMHYTARIEAPPYLGESGYGYEPDHPDGPWVHKWQASFPFKGEVSRPLFPSETRVFYMRLHQMFARNSHTEGTVRCTLFADDMPFRVAEFSSSLLSDKKPPYLV